MARYGRTPKLAEARRASGMVVATLGWMISLLSGRSPAARKLARCLQSFSCLLLE
jgi:hypothetical protein